MARLRLGTLDERIAELDRIGVDLVRFTINWHQVEQVRDERRWGSADAVLKGLRDHGIAPVVTLYGAPRWANRGRAPSRAPTSGSTFAASASAAAKRYPWREPLARLDQAQPAPLAAPHDPEHLRHQAAEPRVRGDSQGEPRCQGRRWRDCTGVWLHGGAARGRDSGMAGRRRRAWTRTRTTPIRWVCSNAFDRKVVTNGETITMATLERLQRKVCAASACGCGSG